MSAHVLLNLLNGLWKSNKMRGLSSILLLFCNEFNSKIQEHKYQISIYHIVFKLFCNRILMRNVKILLNICGVIIGVFHYIEKISVNHL